MPNQTIPKPLSGAEVRTAIVHDINRILELDGRLAAHIAYDSFSFTASIKITLPSGIQQEITREISGFGGSFPSDETASTEESIVSRDLQPPNAVRMETDQPVPTLVEEKGSMVEKYISYAGKDASGRPALPKQAPEPPKRNVVKGAQISGG